ncbi:MAG: CPBP family intramembrane metalloprotease [Chlorobi bacterium]|nr:CPBP family intramembrane metalloprotease [Chlorobiota bacterium]
MDNKPKSTSRANGSFYVPPIVRLISLLALVGVGFAVAYLILFSTSVSKFNISEADLEVVPWHQFYQMAEDLAWSNQKADSLLAQVWKDEVKLLDGHTYLIQLYELVKYQLLIQTLVAFLIPALFAMFLFGHLSDLWRFPTSPVAWLSVVLVVLGSVPFTYWLMDITAQFIPQDLIAKFKPMDIMRQGTLALLLWVPDASQASMWQTILLMAVLPAVAEELIFRGTFLKYLHETTNTVHFAVFLTAFLFALLHFSVTQFIPIFVMGLVLGYLYIYSGTIWIPIIVHSLFNSVPVVIHFLYRQGKLSIPNPNEFSIPHIYGIAGGILVIAGIIILGKWRQKSVKAG